MSEDHIWTITTLSANFLHDRCVGWTTTKEEAVGLCKGNYGDICEMGYYRYAVVEKSHPGLYGCGGDGSGDITWFQLKPKNLVTGDRQWAPSNVEGVEIDPPKGMEDACYFGIG
jgi:hypothetical protein